MKKMMVVLLSLLTLSACSGLPGCGSSDAKETIKKIINGKINVFGVPMLGEFVELNNVEEVAYNSDSEIRACSALLSTTKGTEAISYSIKWENKEKGTFYLEIN